MSSQTWSSREGSYRGDETGFTSFGVFLVIVVIIYLTTPNILGEVNGFIRDFQLVQIFDDFSWYAPSINHPVVYAAAERFCFLFGLVQVGILIFRFARRSSIRGKAETASGIMFWIGMGYILSLLAAGTLSWFSFLVAFVILPGISIFVIRPLIVMLLSHAPRLVHPRSPAEVSVPNKSPVEVSVAASHEVGAMPSPKELERPNVQGRVIIPSEAETGKRLEVQFDLVNAGSASAVLVKLEEALPKAWKAVRPADRYQLVDGSLDLRGKKLDPLETEIISLAVETNEAGTFEIKPKAVFIDHGQLVTRDLDAAHIAIVAPQEGPEARARTGNMELDQNLYGGIPANYAIIVTAEPSDEVDSLLRGFIQVGLQHGENVLYISNELDRVADYIEQYPMQLYALLATPQPDVDTTKKPNVKTVRGIENLSELNIQLMEILDKNPTPKAGMSRACILLLSEILLTHHALTTRKWLSDLLARLKTRNYTILATANPLMHSTEETHAITDIFEGHLDIREARTLLTSKRSLRIKRLLRQKYRDQEIILTK